MWVHPSGQRPRVLSRPLTKLSCCGAGFNSTEGQGQRLSSVCLLPSQKVWCWKEEENGSQESLLVAIATWPSGGHLLSTVGPGSKPKALTQSRSAHALKEQSTQEWESRAFSGGPLLSTEQHSTHPCLWRWHPAWLGFCALRNRVSAGKD